MESIELPEAGDDGPIEVLLLLHGPNRELLAGMLGETAAVVTPDGDEGLPGTFDICVLDAPSLAESEAALRSRKADAEPVFLPYLLVVREDTRPYTSPLVRELVDEIIVIPTDPTALGMRMEGLLRARRQSAELKRRKEVELRELTRQNERLDEFASIVSHDLRNPLMVITASVDLARETGDLSNLDVAAEGIERMESLIEGVLELARSGKLVGETATIELETVATRAWHSVRTGRATLVVERSMPFEADEERFRTLFENLYRNAVEHGSTGNRSVERSDDAVEHGSTGPASRARQDAVEHGIGGVGTGDGPALDPGDGDDSDPELTVTVGLLGPKPYPIGFFVEDDGPGIPEEEREAVLEHGYTTRDGGSGFGLAIVNSIAEAHGWSLRVTDASNGGARFEFDCSGSHPTGEQLGEIPGDGDVPNTDRRDP